MKNRLHHTRVNQIEFLSTLAPPTTKNYRLGDIIKLGRCTEEYPCPGWAENSIGFHVMNDLTKRTNTYKNRLLNFTKYVQSQKDSVTTDRDTLYVHLRLGDVLSSNKFKSNNKRVALSPSDIVKKIHKISGITKIILIYGLHHRNKKYNDDAVEFINQLKNKLKTKYIVKTRANKDVDEDMLLLCNAKNILLTSRGLYSKRLKFQSVHREILGESAFAYLIEHYRNHYNLSSGIVR